MNEENQISKTLDSDNQPDPIDLVNEVQEKPAYKPNRHERRKQAAIARREQREKLRKGKK